ncbi:hypothetical protein ACFYU9_13800 [Streptomyces sp. NPDC004327]|uniref:hypothetical protein n=1 Tax=unclassified Streptomyces TaxID=2593676 RepID=UPI0036CD89EA
MRRRATGLLVLGAAVLLAGCGIRTTSVPVDAGAAPSRVPCDTSAGTTPDGVAPGTGVPLRVYLLCGAQLERVERRSPLPEEKATGDPLRTASALLAQLETEPSAEERQAGFTTAVKGPLFVTRARKGDPKDTLRLSRQPEDLPPAALAQIVCTFAESPAGAASAAGDAVVLGGPGSYEPRRYLCTEQLKARPESAVSSLPAWASASAPGSAPASVSPSAP